MCQALLVKRFCCSLPPSQQLPARASVLTLPIPFLPFCHACSGGPALRGANGGNVVVGVAFQNLPSADSIGYIIPIVSEARVSRMAGAWVGPAFC